MKRFSSTILMLFFIFSFESMAVDKQKREPMKYFMPSPSEMATAVSKLGINNLSRYVSTNLKATYDSEEEYAIVMGILSADAFYYALEGRSKELQKTFFRIIDISKKLNIDSDIEEDMHALKNLLAKKEWNEFTRQMEKMLQKMEKIYQDDYRDDLAILTMTSAWAEGLLIVSSALENQYSHENTDILFQPALAYYLLGQVSSHKTVRTLPKAKAMKKTLIIVAETIDHSEDFLFSEKQVQRIASAVKKLKTELIK